ncbi:MAG: hypothetical protein M3O30_07715 [Planctomycetota bacterium]|nr:hypothetical protein [Planctomycetota bacterium]
MLLTKHEGVTFQNQTIYISGQAFVRCAFVSCTLILRETLYHLEGCSFERCNWHVDRVLLWGSPESIREIKALISLIEQAQLAQLPTGNSAMNTDQRVSPAMGSPVSSIPPLTAGLPKQPANA